MSLARHSLELVLFFCILCGPLPLALVFVLLTEAQPLNEAGPLSETNPPHASLAHYWLVLLTGWCLIQASLGILIGLWHHFGLSAAVGGELVVGAGGMLWLVSLRRQLAWRLRPVLAGLWHPAQPLNSCEGLLLGVLACVGFSLLYRIGTRAVTNYDSLAFHLPTMVQWCQSGRFVGLAQFEDFGAHYPFNWEVVCALFLLPFHGDFLVALPNFLAWLLLGLAVYGLCAKLGLARLRRLASACLVLTVPVLLQIVLTLHIDIAIATFFMVGLYLGWCWMEAETATRRTVYGAMGFATLGLLNGIKSSGPVYILLILGLLMVLRLSQRTGDRPPSSVTVPGLRALTNLMGCGLMLCGLFLGSFWYMKNLMEVGNPLGHVQLAIAHHVVFPGTLTTNAINRTSLASLFEWRNPVHRHALIDDIMVSLYLPFCALLWQALVLPLSFGIACRRVGDNHRHEAARHEAARHELVRHFLFPLLLGLGGGYLYWHTPFAAAMIWGPDVHFDGLALAGSFRYGFIFIAALGIVAAAGMRNLPISDASIVAIVLISATGSAIIGLEQSNILYLAIALPLIGAGWHVLAASDLRPSLKRVPPAARQVALVASLIVLAVKGTYALRVRHDRDSAQTYHGLPEFIEAHVARDETIGYLYSHQSYLFYGKALDHRVEYVMDQADDEQRWLQSLRERHINMVAVGPIIEAWGPPHKIQVVAWLNDPNGPFVRVFGDDLTKAPALYRFKSGIHRDLAWNTIPANEFAAHGLRPGALWADPPAGTVERSSEPHLSSRAEIKYFDTGLELW